MTTNTHDDGRLFGMGADGTIWTEPALALDAGDGPDLFIDRVPGSGAIRIASIVDAHDGTGPFRHQMSYFLWDPEDGDPADEYVRDVESRGWSFCD